MAGKKTKKSEVARKPQPTVQHESSANSAQNSGIRENSQSNQAVNSSNKKENLVGPTEAIGKEVLIINQL